MSVISPSLCSPSSNDEGAVTVIVEVYISISSICQPLGAALDVIEVMLWLLKVVPVCPGMLTRMLSEGTSKLLVSSLLHAAITMAKQSITNDMLICVFIYIYSLLSQFISCWR